MSNSFSITVAGLSFKIIPCNDNLSEKFKNYITKEDANIVISMNEKDIEVEKEIYISGLKEGENQYDFSSAYYESLAIYRKITDIAADYDIILFHGSAFAFDGEGVIITAPGGTGKSTHSRIWREVYGDRVRMINDDKPWIRLIGGRFFVCGTPFNGKHNLGENIMVPLKKICIIGRSETNRAEISENPLPQLIKQTYRPKDAAKMQKVLKNICLLQKETEIFDIYCNMENDAATTVCGVIFPGKE